MKVVLVTAPPEHAQRLASALVEARVAACVNLLPGVASVYRWEGAVETSGETLLVVKTSDEALDALFAAVARLHPYSVPEIVAIDASRVHGPYLDWVRESTSAPRT